MDRVRRRGFSLSSFRFTPAFRPCNLYLDMYLRRLEMQGFKTFASKTVLEFAPESQKRRGVTAIVGPNGSGKSNVADAIRWVMGEQSMKLLRGKKSEDLIFSGSEKKSRSGFAEVSMTLANERPTEELNMAEIVVTRRLYRDGKSEFEINKRPAKLGDVAMLLAQAGIGQRTYSVIGQGMVDAVLSASPSERKEFFDEAAGLRPFQMKRHQSVNKLQSSREKLVQADALLREITPRLSSLERQMKRLEQRDDLEREKTELEEQYYGSAWSEIGTHLLSVAKRVGEARDREKGLLEKAGAAQEELMAMEKAVPPSQGFEGLRHQLTEISEARSNLRERQLMIQSQIELIKAKAKQEQHAPLSLGNIIKAVEYSQKQLDTLLTHIESATPNVDEMRSIIKDLHEHHSDFSSKLQKPASEAPAKAVEIDPSLQTELEEIARQMEELVGKAKAVQTQIDEWDKTEAGKRAHLFETQRQLNQLRDEAREAEREASIASVELARWETKKESFLQELRQYAPEIEKRLDEISSRTGTKSGYQEFLPRLMKVRSQLEWIGNIDPATQKEYEETKERFEFLNTQVEDLQSALKSLDLIIKELDDTIRVRSEQAFHTLNSAFSKTFRILFGGGEASLVQLPPEPKMDEEGNLIPPPADAPPAGIDILATPPGKRLKSIALLSGGERALTSIALISAIMATNPSPFIVLDEVDAALDEFNTKKYADILQDYAADTQFIVVTHNRTTMHQSGALYGVTMGEDGTSKILSVKLEDIGELRGR